MSATGAEVLFLAVAAAHLGFQATVTLVVYPSLAEVAHGPDAGTWQRVHANHSRRIVPVVGALYGGLVLSCAALLWRAPSGWAVIGAVGAILAITTTAFAAAPLHGRLSGSDGRADLVSIERLLRIDRVRAVGAVVASVGAVAALLLG